MNQINAAITNTADQSDNRMSHDAINRYLREERLTSRLVWEQTRSQLSPSPHGEVIFDNTVLDQNFSHQIEWVRCNTAAMQTA